LCRGYLLFPFFSVAGTFEDFWCVGEDSAGFFGVGVVDAVVEGASFACSGDFGLDCCELCEAVAAASAFFADFADVSCGVLGDSFEYVDDCLGWGISGCEVAVVVDPAVELSDSVAVVFGY